METKFGMPQTVRNLFERCITLNLKPRKMKFFFKRYLMFELSQGDQARAEVVKKKANDYVNSIIMDNDDSNSNNKREGNVNDDDDDIMQIMRDKNEMEVEEQDDNDE